MDSYGVVSVGDYLLSIPGLFTYLVVLCISLYFVGRLTDGFSPWYRTFNFIVYGLLVAAAVAWGFIALGLWFYVEA